VALNAPLEVSDLQPLRLAAQPDLEPLFCWPIANTLAVCSEALCFTACCRYEGCMFHDFTFFLNCNRQVLKIVLGVRSVVLAPVPLCNDLTRFSAECSTFLQSVPDPEDVVS
jgi:hypothetical protein